MKVEDAPRIENWNTFRDQEISIPQIYFDDLLSVFFEDGIDPELPINAHRFCTDIIGEGVPIYGFEWYLNPNFYTYGDIEAILKRIKDTAEVIRSGHIEQLPYRQKTRLRYAFSLAAENESEMTYKDAMNVTADFYEALISRLRRMMDESPMTDVLSVMAP